MTFISFELNNRQIRRTYALALLACGVVVAGCITAALLSGKQLAGPDHNPFLIMALGLGLFFSGITFLVLATRLFDLRSSPNRVTVDDRGIWMGETYHSFTDLEAVAVTPAEHTRGQRRRLVLTRQDADDVVYRLGAPGPGRATAEADYRQFVQVLTTAVAGHPNLPPLRFLD